MGAGISEPWPPGVSRPGSILGNPRGSLFIAPGSNNRMHRSRRPRLIQVHSQHRRPGDARRETDSEVMKVAVGHTEDKGRGVFAARAIRAFEAVALVEYVREVTAESPLLECERYEHQIYLPDGRVYLVAEPMCYTNHSCEPNAFIYSAVKERYFVIAKGLVELSMRSVRRGG